MKQYKVEITEEALQRQLLFINRLFFGHIFITNHCYR